jgi:1,4-dihydroxy-6-naphthoate synthase
MTELKKLALAHSPDSDDAFMFWALAKGLVRSDGVEFEHTLSDIQSLNQAALEGRYDITAISVHAYPYINQDYALLNVGASVGDGYGPCIVARQNFDIDELSGKLIAIPGSLTTAALVLRLAIPDARTEEIAFDAIMDAVESGDVDAGVIIHEGQITYRDRKLHRLIDLGEWWKDETGLPLPLGANVIRKELEEETRVKAVKAIRSSVKYALGHRAEAISYARDFGRDLKQEQVDAFVSMYVNDYTLDWGEKGRNAVRELLKRGADAGIVPEIDNIEFIG